jgi:hypothetical protein
MPPPFDPVVYAVWRFLYEKDQRKATEAFERLKAQRVDAEELVAPADPSVAGPLHRLLLVFGDRADAMR